MKKLISILIFFSLSSYSDAVEEVNRVLKKDLSYQQFTTINDEKKISTGVIKKSDGETIIEVISPYKEKYVINKDKIIVYDFEFNNTSEIEISNIDNLVFDIILYGIEKSKVNDPQTSSASPSQPEAIHKESSRNPHGLLPDSLWSLHEFLKH